MTISQSAWNRGAPSGPPQSGAATRESEIAATSGTALERAGMVLAVDLAAIQRNWKALRAKLRQGATCGAVVKADAYGLGLAQAGPALASAGCRRFFVSLPDEGLALRALLPRVEIYVLNGLFPGVEGDYVAQRLTPVLNSLGEVDAWAAAARKAGTALAAALHVDTGMARLGLPPAEVAALADDHGRFSGVSLQLVMSHLACADDPEDARNLEQAALFAAARAKLPPAPASLANSAGILLGPDYHADVVRPGLALYGAAPLLDRGGALEPVLRLYGRVLQVRELPAGATVGYGASFATRARSRIATVAVGYADGYFRCLGGRSVALLAGIPVPLVGRVSMDLLTFDVTAVPQAEAQPGAWVELVGRDFGVDDLAQAAGTVAYEVLTSLGRRAHRRYAGAEAPAPNAA